MAKKYWFNTKTQEVEFGRRSLSVYRLGPFETQEEASKAEAIVKKKGEKLIEEDQSNEFSDDGNSRD